MKKVESRKFPPARMGVLAPGPAHTRPSARPPVNTRGNFLAHILGGGDRLCFFSRVFSAWGGRFGLILFAMSQTSIASSLETQQRVSEIFIPPTAPLKKKFGQNIFV